MPNGIVCLTFDVDAVSNWINSGVTTPAPLSRGEFGAVAVERILHALDVRGIRSTWFIPGHTIETYPEQCRAVMTGGHEVVLHRYLHENVSRLSEAEERDWIDDLLDMGLRFERRDAVARDFRDGRRFGVYQRQGARRKLAETGVNDD